MNTGQIVGSPDVLRRMVAGRTVGLVPTMGAFHEGHLSLIRRSAAENGTTVVSIFVNPKQFDDPSDLAAYPRELEDDAAQAIGAGSDVIYAPAPETVYPRGFATTVSIRGVTDLFEGGSRPGHFDGVATVVAILLNTVRPDRAYFGEKDFQQLAMVRRMHADLRLPGEIVGCPTVRETDGLALSSRNARLSRDAREAARAIPIALAAMQRAYQAGERASARIEEIGQDALSRTPAVLADYVAVIDPATVRPQPVADEASRALIAATVDGVRLIDNDLLSSQPVVD